MERHYVNPGNRHRLMSLLSKRGSVKDFETRLVLRNGKEIFVWVTAHARKNNEGQVVYYEKIIKDVTTRKKLEEEPRDKNRLLERYS